MHKGDTYIPFGKINGIVAYCCIFAAGAWCVVMCFNRKLTHWQFPVLLFGIHSASQLKEGGLWWLCSPDGYEIEEDH